MRFKLVNIKGCKTCKQVLVSMTRNDESENVIEISAWHEHSEDGWFFQYDNIKIENERMFNRYLLDFTEISANKFANSFTF